jgi:hypothetical protein
MTGMRSTYLAKGRGYWAKERYRQECLWANSLHYTNIVQENEHKEQDLSVRIIYVY